MTAWFCIRCGWSTEGPKEPFSAPASGCLTCHSPLGYIDYHRKTETELKDAELARLRERLGRG